MTDADEFPDKQTGFGRDSNFHIRRRNMMVNMASTTRARQHSTDKYAPTTWQAAETRILSFIFNCEEVGTYK